MTDAKTHEKLVKAASALAAAFKQETGAPLIVSPNQMKFFRANGVDCSNLMGIKDLPR